MKLFNRRVSNLYLTIDIVKILNFINPVLWTCAFWKQFTSRKALIKAVCKLCSSVINAGEKNNERQIRIAKYLKRKTALITRRTNKYLTMNEWHPKLTRDVGSTLLGKRNWEWGCVLIKHTMSWPSLYGCSKFKLWPLRFELTDSWHLGEEKMMFHGHVICNQDDRNCGWFPHCPQDPDQFSQRNNRRWSTCTMRESK